MYFYDLLICIEREASRIIRTITQALHSLHQQGILHLDVKPENVIFESNDKNADMKLTDFGCSMFYTKPSSSSFIVKE